MTANTTPCQNSQKMVYYVQVHRGGLEFRKSRYIMSYKHTATSDVVYSQLKERILHLELPPGAAISEIETAAAYHISRTPVRDAFKRLEQEGLLEIRPHIGTFISLIDLNAVSDVLYIREVLEFSVFSDLTRNIHFLGETIYPILEYQKNGYKSTVF